MPFASSASPLPSLRFALLIICIISLPRLNAQTLSRHGDVIKIEDAAVEVQLLGQFQVDVGTEGYLFITNTINGKINSIKAADIRVSMVDGQQVTCRIINRFRPIVNEYWFGVIFERVSPIVELGTLEVKSEPQSATLFVDGERKGLTPLRLDYVPGFYQIRVMLDGFVTVEQTVEVVKKQVNTLHIRLRSLFKLEEGRSPDFYLSKGIVYFDTGDYRLARVYLEKALALKPEDKYLKALLARTQVRMDGVTQDAQVKLDQLDSTSQDASVLDSNAGEISSWRLEARRYINQEDYVKAKPFVMSLLSALPEDIEALRWVKKIGAPRIERVNKSRQLVHLSDEQALSMILVPGHTFKMGDQRGEGDVDERPVHAVTVFNYWMGVHEVTNAQFAAFLNAQSEQIEDITALIDIEDRDCTIQWVDGRYLSSKGFEKHPVVEVTWYGAQAFSEWMGGRLPTEVEWEFAARNGGQSIKYPTGDTLSSDQANIAGRQQADQWETSSPVGRFPANDLGLFDMAGNVWEWCLDWYATTYYAHSRATNPTGPPSGQTKILRGGSWFDTIKQCRVTYRNHTLPDDSRNNIGFRVVMVQR